MRQANELGPGLSQTWEIGLYIQNRLFDEALAELEKAKRDRKNDSILIYSTGLVYAAQGKRAEAATRDSQTCSAGWASRRERVPKPREIPCLRLDENRQGRRASARERQCGKPRDEILQVLPDLFQ